MTIINLIINFIANGISAYSMSGNYGKDSAYAYLFYSVCAYGLPLIIGAMADYVTYRLKDKTALIHRRFYWGIIVLGAIFSLTGMYAGFYALGAGNALVTVGCCLGAASDNSGRKVRGSAVGMVLAAGIPGILVGDVLADFTSLRLIIQNVWIVLLLLMVLIGLIYIVCRERNLQFVTAEPGEIDGELINNPSENSKEAAVETSEYKDKKYKDKKYNNKYKIDSSKTSLKRDTKALLGDWGSALGCLLLSGLCAYVYVRNNYEWQTELVPAVVSVVLATLGMIAGSMAWDFFEKSRKVILIIVAAVMAVIAFAMSMFDFTYIRVVALLLANTAMAISVCGACKRLKNIRGLVIGLSCAGGMISAILAV